MTQLIAHVDVTVLSANITHSPFGMFLGSKVHHRLGMIAKTLGTSKNLLRAPIIALVGARNPHVSQIYCGLFALCSGRLRWFLDVSIISRTRSRSRAINQYSARLKRVEMHWIIVIL